MAVGAAAPDTIAHAPARPAGLPDRVSRYLARWEGDGAAPPAGVRVTLEGHAVFGYLRPVVVRLDLVGSALRWRTSFGERLPRHPAPVGTDTWDGPAPRQPSLAGAAVASLWLASSLLAGEGAAWHVDGGDVVADPDGVAARLRLTIGATGELEHVACEPDPGGPDRPRVEASVLAHGRHGGRTLPSHVLVGTGLGTEAATVLLEARVRRLEYLRA